MSYANFKRALWGACKLFTITMLCFCAAVFSPVAQAQVVETRTFISAQDVYENPDDHELNLEYAKQEIRRGEMLNAASALERMLYANPNWHSSRLLYAAVLYRLDDSKAALRELSLLKGRELNDHQMETYQRYLTEFEKPLPALTATTNTAFEQNSVVYQPFDPVSAEVIVGVRLDNNAGNALSDEGFGFENNRGDVSVHAQGRIKLKKRISAKKNVTAHAAIGGQFRSHETFSETDYNVIDLQAGLSARPSGKGHMSFNIDARQVNISGEKYLNQIGPRVTFQQKVTEKSRATVTVAAYDQDYDALRRAPREDERDGVKTRFQLGVQTALNPSQKINWAVSYDTKDAEIGAFSYDGPRGLVSFTHEFKNKTYLNSQAQVRRLNYKGSLDAAVDERKDTRVFLRQSLGAPLKMFMPNSKVDNVDIEFGINYNDRKSNIDSNDYDNLGVDFKLKFNF